MTEARRPISDYLASLSTVTPATGDKTIVLDASASSAPAVHTFDGLQTVFDGRYAPLADTIRISALDGRVLTGSPTVVYAGAAPVYSFPDAATTGIQVPPFPIPLGWSTVHVDVIWCGLGTTPADVNLRGSFTHRVVVGTAIPTFGLETAVIATAAAQHVPVRTRISTAPRTVTGGELAVTGVRRQGSEASDPYASAIGVIEFQIVRVS